MSVKGLVGLYESKERNSNDTLPTRRARFLHHPLLVPQVTAETESNSSLSDRTAVTSNPSSIPLLQKPIGHAAAVSSPKEPLGNSALPEAVKPSHFVENAASSSNPFIRTSRPRYERILNDDFHDNVSSATTFASRFSSKRRIGSYLPLNDLSSKPAAEPLEPPVSAEPRTLDAISEQTKLRRANASHRPVPARMVFSRTAPALHLPHLDNYLESIPAPNFTSIKPESDSLKPLEGNEKSIVGPQMFPPLDLLQGQSLENLKHNSPRPQFYNDRNSILSSITNAVLGFAGSSAIASYYSLQGVYDGVQIFALILSSVVPRSSLSLASEWRRLFLSTIPNILALNIPTKLIQSLIFLVILMAISGLLLYQFHNLTFSYSPDVVREGLQPRHPPPSRLAIVVSFILTVLYLPLSTIAVHGILWSSDFWVVPNPYINIAVSPNEIPPLGPEELWRDPLDFCYTSTMRKDEANLAPVVVTLSVVTFVFMTVWFPIRLMQTIRQSLPQVDPYTERGTKRSKPEMELEYQRLIERDQNPFAFLYKDFRRSWGTYKSVYLWAKLSALLIVAILSPDNCAFRSFNREMIGIVRQSVLTVSMLGWFVLQCILVPFVDPIDNASEWTSRANYLATSALGLAVALNIPGKDILNGVILYIIYVLTYGLNIYFSLIATGFVRKLFKRILKRIDFSIDIYSPKLDLSPQCPHTRRRIWQETVSAVLFTDQECRMPAKHHIIYADSRDFEWPPYLLDFQQTPAERHAENLKILREVGIKGYARAVSLCNGPEANRFKRIQHQIEKYYIGPDSFWKPHSTQNPESEESIHNGCKNYFGNAWWIPFPPTLVIRYDQGGHAVLSNLYEFEAYLVQNEMDIVRQRRELRLALRALDGQIVVWPYTRQELVGSRTWWSGRRFSMQKTTHYHSCVFEIRRKGLQYWRDIPLGSGFQVQMTYAKDVQLDGDIIGLNDDYDLTPTLAQFLHMNERLVELHLDQVISDSRAYRRFYKTEVRQKEATLSYHFLTEVYNWPSDSIELIKTVEESESDVRVKQAVTRHEDGFAAAYERMQMVGRSEVTTWWYLFWDDFWRRNYDTIPALKNHAADFNPHYPSSIAYRPLPRSALEAFLGQRGIFSPRKKIIRHLHHGFLNKIYFRLNQIVFHNTDKAILVHVGNHTPEIDLEDVDITTHVRTSTMGTGGGTDLDDESIRVRPAFKWEDVFEDPFREGGKKRSLWFDVRKWKGMMAVWFGITPLDRRKMRTNGIALDVKLDRDGRYTAMERTRTLVQ